MNQNFAIHTIGKGLQSFLNILFFFIFIVSLITTFSLPAIKEAGTVFWIIILSGFAAIFFAAMQIYSSSGNSGTKTAWKENLIPGIALLGIFSLILAFSTFLVSLASSEKISTLLVTNPFLLLTLDTSSPIQNSAAENIAGWMMNGLMLVITAFSMALLCAFLWYILNGGKTAARK